MSLIDVFQGKQSLLGWITGRDPKEADVYANYDKVQTTSDNIRSIAKNQVLTAQESIYAAFNQLNSVKGLAEYVGTIEVGNYDTVFTSISATIEDIADQLDGKAEDIKTFEEAPWWEKGLSTATMGVFKLGEGFLSVFEDLGDGVASLIGFGAGLVGAKDLQKGCENFIKKEWSHDMLNFYYESDFAKASLFTEDSAIAGGLKIVGKTAGYLYAGGVVAGQLGLSGATNAGIGVLRASGSTWGATIAGFSGGLGAGTESGLNAGKTFNQSFGQGLITGTIQGGLAFAGGKWGESVARKRAIAEATKSGDKAAIQAANASKLSDYQGYSDAFTQAGERFGTASRDVLRSGAKALKDTASASLSIHKKSIDANFKTDVAAKSQEAFKGSLKELAKENPISQGLSAAKNLGGKAITSAQGFRASVKEDGLKATLGSKVAGARESTATAISNIKEAGLVGTAKNVLGNMSPETPGIIAAAAGSTINNTVQQSGLNAAAERDALNQHGLVDFKDEAQQFVRDNFTKVDGEKTPDPQDPEITPTPSESASPTPTPTPSQSTGGGGPSGGGPSGGGPSGGTPATTAAPATTTPATTTPATTAPPTTAAPTTAAPGTETPITVVTPTTEPYTEIITTEPGDHSGVGFDGETLDYDSLELENAEALGLLDDLDEATSSIDEIVKGSTYTKIPDSAKPMTTTKKKSSSSVIPIAAGLSVAAAAGIGAKAYMDRKKNNETGEYDDEDEEYEDEYEDDSFQSDEWTGDEDTVEVSYDAPTTTDDAYLEEDGFYGDNGENYTARNSSELADVQ